MSTPVTSVDAEIATARLLARLRVAGPVAVVVVALIAGWLRGPPMAVLVLAAGALAGVIGLFWQSVRTLVGETTLSGADAFALGAPRVEEERKRAVLRAMKDVEFERSVGKISEADYRELVDGYRAEAKRLLRQIDDVAQPRRDRVVPLVEARLRAAGLLDVAPKPEVAPELDAAPEPDVVPLDAPPESDPPQGLDVAPKPPAEEAVR